MIRDKVHSDGSGDSEILSRRSLQVFRTVRSAWWFVAALVLQFSATTQFLNAQEENYEVPPEARVQEGVPQGKVEGPFTFRNSRIFPGTVREYWVYVPAKYDPAKPPCLMIVQDGIGRANDWKLTTVLDNMIHSGEIPAQLAIYVNHGVVTTDNPMRSRDSIEVLSTMDWEIVMQDS